MAITNRHSPKKSESPRRREIADAAIRMFHDKGYESTTIQEIADEVGLLKGSLYYHIDSKEDLLFELIERVHDDLLDNWEALANPDDRPVDALRTFITAHVVYTADHLMQVHVFLHDFRALSMSRRTTITEKRDDYDSILRGIIADAQTAGELRTDLTPKLAALAVFGTMNWVYRWYDPEGAWSAQDVARFIADFCIPALAPNDDVSAE